MLLVIIFTYKTKGQFSVNFFLFRFCYGILGEFCESKVLLGRETISDNVSILEIIQKRKSFTGIHRHRYIFLLTETRSEILLALSIT